MTLCAQQQYFCHLRGCACTMRNTVIPQQRYGCHSAEQSSDADIHERPDQLVFVLQGLLIPCKGHRLPSG